MHEAVIPLLHIDEALLVADKPAGLPTLPDGWAPESPCLAKILEEAHGKLWVVHRLDRGTSGAIVFARSAESHRTLNMQFDAHEVAKVYRALVRGVPEWETRRIGLPLRADGDRRHRTVIDHKQGKPAVTHLTVLERLRGAALVEARPETGRTHQIRVHLAALGLPLLGDDLYTRSAQRGAAGNVFGRPALHAWSVTFTHPTSGERLTVEAPHPADFLAYLARRTAPAHSGG